MFIPGIPRVAVEELVVDGTGEDGAMVGYAPGDCSPTKLFPLTAPFALFSPTLQTNVGGPYAELGHAEAALDLVKTGKMTPYTTGPVVWVRGGVPHYPKTSR